MHIQESGEMYLETILVLSKKNSYVRSIDVCEHMGYSKPSVSRAIGILRKAEYITVDKNGHLFLTDEGRTIAERIYERHTIFTQFLTLIGVSPEVASEDACKIEHTISDESFAAIKRFIDEKSSS